MNENTSSESVTNRTLEKLANLMTARELAQSERDKLAAKRFDKTDGKIDTLADAIQVLVVSHAESQRDNKEIFKAQERHEENQKEQGIRLSAHSEILAVHEVKINNSKSILREVGVGLMAIVTAVVISVVIK